MVDIAAQAGGHIITSGQALQIISLRATSEKLSDNHCCFSVSVSVRPALGTVFGTLVG